MYSDVNSYADNLCVVLKRIRQQAPPTALLVQVIGFALQACLPCLQPLSQSCLFHSLTTSHIRQESATLACKLLVGA